MFGAKYDFNRDRERRAGIDDMVNKNWLNWLFLKETSFFFQVFLTKNSDSDISHNLKIRFDVNYIYVSDFQMNVVLFFLTSIPVDCLDVHWLGADRC